MNNNQSIDEILSQLKTSVSSDDSLDADTVAENATDEYSEEVLKRELKNQYFVSDDDTSYTAENEYSIDKEFLEEAEVFSINNEQNDADKVEEDIENTELEETDVADLITEAVEDIVDEVIVEEQEGQKEQIDENINLVMIETYEESGNGEVFEELVAAIDTFTEDVEDVSEMFEGEFEDDSDADDINEDVQEDLNDFDVDIEQSVDDEITFEITEKEISAQEFDEGFETEDYEQDIVYTAIELESQQNSIEIADADSKVEISDMESEVSVEESVPDTDNVLDADNLSDSGPAQQPSTYISLMRNSGVDFSANDTNIKTRDNSSYLEECEDVFEDVADDTTDDLDLSTINLMMQLGEHDEVAERIGEQNIENIIEDSQDTDDTDDIVAPSMEQREEYVDKGQSEAIRTRYKKKYIAALLSMCGCILLAIMALVFEALPILGVDLNGVFDYLQYPAFYILIGLQFVIFSAAICVKQLWSGVRSIMLISPNRYSPIVVMICVTVVYDVWIAIAVAVGGDNIPPLFDAMTTVAISISSVIDFFKVAANMNTFSVYSSDESKFTLADERQCGKIAEKMYAGGLDISKKIYTAASIDFPRGFFRGIAEKDGQSRSMTLVMVISALISVIAAVVSAILGFDVYASLGAFMICMFTSMPIILICADNIPLATAAIRLAKRGIAIAGKGSVEKYSKCDVMVFGDRHMFKKCKTEDIGIAIYDKGVTYLVLGCVSAIYDKIGGPLSEIEVDLPDVFKFHNVDIRRVTRNGIEAVVEKKHVVLLGERSFLLRYGIAFPEDEKQSDRSSLCVSLNGGATAKLSVKYETEPLFEMLIERLNREGVTCAIETYDPLINSDMILRSRTLGVAPVSVVHKNADDYRMGSTGMHRGRLDGVIACASRLKLAELEVWLKKLTRVEKRTKLFAACSCGVGLLGDIAMICLGVIGSLNQYHVFFYLLLQLGLFLTMLFYIIPGKKYFTVEELYDELERISIKQQRKLERDAQRREKRISFDKTQEESNTDE